MIAAEMMKNKQRGWLRQARATNGEKTSSKRLEQRPAANGFLSLCFDSLHGSLVG
jgi:hypothetical protein